MNSIKFTTDQIRPIECYKEAWEILKPQYWMLFLVTFLGMILASVIPIVIAGAMMCGIYLCFFQAMRGEKVEVERLFKGFDYFVPSLILMLIVMIPAFLVLIGFYVPFIFMMMRQPRMSEAEIISTMVAVGIVELIVIIAMVCFHTLLIFSIPLIVEHKLSVWESIKTSASAVMKNLPGVAGLIGVGFVVALVSYLAFCVGIYFTIPLIMCSTAVAYRKVFPEVRGTQFGSARV